MSTPIPEKKYWKSLAEREHQLDPSAPKPEPMPEAGIIDGLGSGLANMVEGVAGLEMDRAAFLKVMGFGFAGAVMSGCVSKAAEKALPYLVQPEDIIPGESVYYATVCGGCSAGCGALTKNRSGRPLKLEGNPGHPLNHGALCAMGQAAILGVYDSKRLKAPLVGGKESSWSELDSALLAELKTVKAKGGKLRVISRTLISPSLRAEIAAFLASYPGAKHVVYDPLSSSAILDAHAQTHGKRALPRYRFDKAEVIASFGADFLGTWISPVEYAAAYQAGRKLLDKDSAFARHYHVESGLSITGGKADERFTVKPSEMTLVLAHLAKRVSGGLTVPGWASGLDACPGDTKKLDHMAKDLLAAKGKSLVVCGSQDLQAQLITNWINQRLGNYTHTLDLAAPSLQRQGDDQAVAELVEELKKGQVSALLVLDADPVHELAQGPAFAEGLKKVAVSVSFSDHADDTAAQCKFQAPQHHWLESWSDAEPVLGIVGLIQPALSPLASTRSALESLATWMGKAKTDQVLVQDYWKAHVHPKAGHGQGFTSFWENSLKAGFADTKDTASAGAFHEPQPKVAKAADLGLELALYPKVSLQDGRHAVNPWLQELPDPVSKISWDQTAAVAPETAKKLGLKEGDVVKLSVDKESLELPVHLQAGQHPGVISVPFGYGRAGTDRFAAVGPNWLLKKLTVQPGERLGHSVVPLLMLNGAYALPYRGHLDLKATGENRELASTQMHQSLDLPDNLTPSAGKRVPIIQEMSLKEFREGAEAERDDKGGSLYADKEYPGHRWAMAIDMNACNGCSACVLACQVENNVPVVGRDEVRRAHEMHWIRIDKYYSEGEDGLEAVSQPMMCQQCGHAPCEPVCPVDATVHSSEGLNMQVYNRCVGTRYCANNCPFKVRRFNWFDYPHQDQNENLALNPDVTVRTRGVMEKCNFCVQRIQEQKSESKKGDGVIKDGDIKTACQQTCATNAIVFGDINDPNSKVSKLAKNSRAFKVLEELGVKPSITYLAQVRNKS